MKLRDYQQEAVDAVFAYWERAPSTPERPASPLVVMPTGSGKSPTLGETTRRLVQDFGCRVLVATHRAELIKQDARAVRSIWPTAPIGIYSAGLHRKEVDQITICGVQSMLRGVSRLGHIDVLIIDEAHLLSPEDATSYQRMISALRAINPDMRVIGYTATPYRLGQGYLTEGDNALFTAVAYDVDVKRLIRDGWLSPIVTGYVREQINLSEVGIRMGEFAAKDLEMACDVDKINGVVADDVKDALDRGRTSAMIFGTSVAHAKRLRNEMHIRGVSCDVITGETEQGQRDEIIARFKARSLACLSSCDVLTTGFDAPVVDVLALVRPTMSPSLYVQMVGRGMRFAEGKKDCLLLDYGGNIARHGPIDDVRVKTKGKKTDGEAPTKVCPQCMAVQSPAVRVCGHCGYGWPAPERKANDKASNLPALSIDMPPKAPPAPPKLHDVGRVEWYKHHKVGDDTAPPTLRVDYFPPGRLSVRKIASEWVCIEHEEGGFAWRKAMRWWGEHVGCRDPKSVDDAIDLLSDGHMRPVVAIETTRDGKWNRVTAIHHGERKEPGEDETGDSLAPCCLASVDALGFRPDVCSGLDAQLCTTCGKNLIENDADRAVMERQGVACSSCSAVLPNTDLVQVTWREDSLGRRLYFLQCGSCLGNHTGKWLPHTNDITEAARPAWSEPKTNIQEDDLPW
jgi:DNA repair protein RadD